MKIFFIVLLLPTILFAKDIEDLVVTKAKKKEQYEEKIARFFLQLASSVHQVKVDDTYIATRGHSRLSAGYHIDPSWGLTFDYELFLDNDFQTSTISGSQFGLSYCFNTCTPMIKENNAEVNIKELSNWSDAIYLLYNSKSLKLSTRTVSYSGPAFRYEKNYFMNSTYSWNFFGEYQRLLNNDSDMNLILLGAGIRFHIE